MLERAVRLELTNTGFALRRLSRLATRAVEQSAKSKVQRGNTRWPLALRSLPFAIFWNGRRDSNSRIEFGRLACFRLHHFRRMFGVRRQSEAATALWIRGEDQKLDHKSDPKRRRADACRRTPNWDSRQDSNLQPRRSKRRALPFELQEQKNRRQKAVGGRQEKNLGPFCLLPSAYCLLHLVGEDRIELSPRVPRTRMLALHHTP